MTDIDLDEMTRHYLICALWSSTDDDGEPLDRSDAEPSGEMEDSAREDCESFADLAGADLDDMDIAQAGHDFWLTRNHHGAGFWDRGLGERGDRLTSAAQSFGSVDLYIGDDGLIYGN